MPPYVEDRRQLVVEITCRSILRSTAFYRSLGFELVRAEEHFAVLGWEGSVLFLEERGDYLPPAVPAGNVRVMIEDVDAQWQRCLDLGVPILSPLENRYYGLRDFTILDPDGFGLRFGTDIPTPAGQ